MMDFKVDTEKCTQCKTCVQECPVLIINGKSEYPTIKEGKDANCIKCQHCLAVCPTGAVSIWGKLPENSLPLTNELPQTVELENLMKTRRSIRRFKNEEIDATLIHKLVNVALYAPTAQNENSVRLTVVDNRDAMLKLRELAYKHIKLAFEEDRIPESKLFLNNFQKMWYEKNIDIVFRNAPHLVIASAPEKGTLPLIDSSIALTYFDLLANSNGIGTLWDGFAKYLFEDINSAIKTEVGIPEDHVVASVLLFGISAVKFARSIQNDGNNLKTIEL